MIRGALAVAIAVAAAPGAQAASTLSYPPASTTLTVSAVDPAVTLSVFRFNDNPTNCPGALCASRIELRSPQLFSENPATSRCDDVGSGDASAFDCRPLPDRVLYEGAAGRDVVGVDGGGNPLLACPDPVTDLRGNGGDDELTTGCANDVLAGGEGADVLSAGEGGNIVTGGGGVDTLVTGGGGDAIDGGPGSDDLRAGGGDDVLAGGEDDDALSGGIGTDSLSGGPGRDRLDGGDGADDLDGGDGADDLDGGASNDVLRGGPGRDRLVPGTGTDLVEGGDDVDTVSYADRAAPVAVTLNGGADDGAVGESDSVGASVENIVGGMSGDLLVGNDAANDIDGAAGDDVIVPGAGADFVNAGAGNDSIDTRDGVQDRVDCGPDADTLRSDAFDVAIGCEANAATRELMSDVDNDGVSLAGGDCDDHNGALRPGLADVPENGVNEDCVAGDARYPRVLATVSSNWRTTPQGRVRATKLVSNDVPDSATIELRCTGRGCFRGVQRRQVRNGARSIDLRRSIVRRRLGPRAQLEVRVLRPETVGRVWTIRVSRKLEVSTTVRCIRPGAKRPSTCPR